MSTETNPPKELIALNIPGSMSFLAPTIVDDLVRLGSFNDGGYVLPKSIILETKFLVSMGIGDNWDFEDHFLSSNPNIKVHAYDHTISLKKLKNEMTRRVRKLIYGKSNFKEVFKRINRHRKFKNFFQGKVRLYQERICNRATASNVADFQIVIKRADSNNIFLKMDIEGSEYLVIDDIIKNSPKIIGMVIEFHDTGPLRLVFNDSVKKLQNVYEIVHIHANNYCSFSADGVPEALELTFVKKNLCSSRGKRVSLPLPSLDQPSNPDSQDYSMKFAF